MSVYLLDTPASYYFRIKVPKDLRSVIKKREIKLSLKTENRQRATRLATLYAFQWQETFNRLRGQAVTDPLANFTWLKNPVFERRPDGTIRFTADEMDPTQKEAEVAMANAIIDKLGGLPTTLSVIKPPTPAPTPQTGIMLSAAIEDYIRSKGSSWDAQYTSNTRSTFKIALELLGDKSIDEYTENDRTFFFETIQKLPISWDKRKDFKDLPILDIIQLNETKVHAATPKTRTQKAYLNKWVFRFTFYVIAAIFLPCSVECFSFVGGEIKPESQHRFDLLRESSFENFINTSMSFSFYTFPAKISLVETHQSIEESLMKVDGSFLHFFSVRDSNSRVVADKSSDCGSNERKYYTHVVSHNDSSGDSSVDQAIGGIIGILLGSILFNFCISRFG